MELNRFVIGLILVVLVIFVGAIAASDDLKLEDSGDNTNLGQSAAGFAICTHVLGYYVMVNPDNVSGIMPYICGHS